MTNPAYPGYPLQTPVVQPVAQAPAAHAPPVHALPASQPKALIAFLGICAAFPVIAYIIYAFLPSGKVTREEFELVKTVGTALNAVQGLLMFTAFVLFAVWIHGVFKRLRARGVQTSYSPAMAVGCWFIPVANLVMPMLAVKEAWEHVTRRAGGLVVGWWLLYVICTGLRVFFAALSSVSLDVPAAIREVLYIGGWALSLSTIGAFVLWLVIVRTMSREGA